MATADALRAELEKLADGEDWDGCLRIFAKLEEVDSLSADELVQKSACLQLGEELGSLEEAKKALLQALALARDYVPALTDLGWYYYVMKNDAKRGLEYFEKAEDLALGLLDEAVEGKKECLDELAFLADEEE